MTYSQLIKKLRSLYNKKNVDGMARFEINPNNTLGISICVLRDIAKDICKNHALAKKLWDSGIHKAKILASMIDNPVLVDEKQMESWVKQFDSWDICDSGM